MLPTGQRLRKRIGLRLALGREERGYDSPEAAARAFRRSGPTAKTLRKLEAGEGEGAKALHYAVLLARRSRKARDGLIELMDNPHSFTWWRVPRKNLSSVNLVFLQEFVGAEPTAGVDAFLDADGALGTPEETGDARRALEQELRVARAAATLGQRSIEELPENLRKLVKAAAAKNEQVRRFITGRAGGHPLKPIFQDLQRDIQSDEQNARRVK